MRKIILLLCIPFLALSCKKDNERALVISKIRKASKLATLEVIITKVVAAEQTPNGFLKKLVGVKNATFLADTEANIKAGIDFAKVKANSVTIDGTKIEVILPPVEILNFSYPAENFRINEYATNIKPALNRISIDEIDGFYRQAEDDIRENFKYLGIRTTVESKTRILLSTLLRQLGFTEIIIDFEVPEKGNSPLDINTEKVEGKEEAGK